jgi:hypothetical protein
MAGLRALLGRTPLTLAGRPEFSPWPTAGPVRLPLRLGDADRGGTDRGGTDRGGRVAGDGPDADHGTQER